MVEKLDAGDMLTRVIVPIERGDHVGTMHDKLSKAGAELLMDTLPALFRNDLLKETQDESKATFAANVTREDEWIDWRKSDVEIFNQIRGLHPWPVAYTTYEGANLKIWWGEPDNTDYSGDPGEIVKKNDNEDFVVVCGNQKGIRITEIQPAGKKRMSVRDYLQGSAERIKTGIHLGE